MFNLVDIANKVLFEHFLDTRHECFGDVTICWMRETERLHMPKSIMLGCYRIPKKEIAINPALDKDWVPVFFVKYVVFHEMLHHVLPPIWRDGKWDVHPEDFKARERSYPEFAEALAWEKANLDRVLRSVVKRPPRRKEAA